MVLLISGPYTQRAIISAIKYLQSSEFSNQIDHKKIVLGGVSRGAITASMVATQEPNLAGLILDAGLYDIKTASHPTTLSNIEKEVGNNLTFDQIKQRSALYHASSIKMPVIILHGNQDPRHSMGQALKFYQAIMSAGAKATLILFPAEHKTPQESRELIIKDFLKNL
jgi:dipeptidyl aminopeptidase/acylaminoacyl peptidase